MAVISYRNLDTTIIINGQVLTDLIEGDFLSIEKPNEMTAHANGTHGAVAIMEKNDADVTVVKVKVMRYSTTDQFLNDLGGKILNASTATEFTRDGEEPRVERWALTNGSQTEQPTEPQNNKDPDDFMMEYTFRFRTGIRSM